MASFPSKWPGTCKVCGSTWAQGTVIHGYGMPNGQKPRYCVMPSCNNETPLPQAQNQQPAPAAPQQQQQQYQQPQQQQQYQQPPPQPPADPCIQVPPLEPELDQKVRSLTTQLASLHCVIRNVLQQYDPNPHDATVGMYMKLVFDKLQSEEASK